MDSSGLPIRSQRTTCPYCGVGCGVVMEERTSGTWLATGDTQHPANFGRLCSKGTALGETLDHSDRLLHPEAEGKQIAWEEAFNRVADAFRETRERHGPQAIAFYLSGQLLTEDYYIANKLMKGFLGSANVDTNSRLCMASTVAGHKRAFGSDTVPGSYEDFEQADVVVLAGSNAAWCHPVLFQRIIRAREERGTRLVVIDPRVTATAEEADLHLPIRAGMDGVLFSRLIVEIAESNWLQKEWLEAHTEGFEKALVRAKQIAPSRDVTAEQTGLDPASLANFLSLWLETPRVVTAFSQGIHQSAQGTDKVNAILNCHLATGRIGKEGAGPFSMTGQPNAMGGREVGGLANTLAAHMDFSPPQRDVVGRFWQAPDLAAEPGLKAVDLFEAVDRGEIRALWIMATNPAVSLPEADRVRSALGKLDFLAVSEVVRSNDSIGPAHVRMPAAGWGEKDGTVTNSERRISRQRAFLPCPADVKPDWQIVQGVARALGHGSAFDYQGPADIFREHVALSSFENEGQRDFDLGGLEGLSNQEFESLLPLTWPFSKRRAGKPNKPVERLFANGGFFRANGKAQFIPIETPGLALNPTADYPYLLNTGRVRDHWHTMTRTGKAPSLGRHIREPFCTLHPDDAKELRVEEGHLVRVRAETGSCDLRARLCEGQPRGTVFVPIHWNDQYASSARIGSLLPAITDPFSGQPESKAGAVAIEALEKPLQGIFLSRSGMAVQGLDYWAVSRIREGQLLMTASESFDGLGWRGYAARIFECAPDALAIVADRGRGDYRAVLLEGDRLAAAAHLQVAAGAPASAWFEHHLSQEKLTPEDRASLLACRSPHGTIATGPIICACHCIRQDTIEAAIKGQGLTDVEGVGGATRAGTNCGSCKPELKKLLVSCHAEV